MKHLGCTVPELDKTLDALPGGAVHQITRNDYERIFGTNSAALGRVRSFAKHHSCVISFADSAILFRKNFSRKASPANEARALANFDEWQTIASAPAGRDLELAVIDEGEVHAVLFACRRDRFGWVRAVDGKGVDVRPTHWREWNNPELVKEGHSPNLNIT